MFTAELDLKCKLCGNKDEYYIMPLDEKVKSGDIIRSCDTFKVQCKQCGKNYIIKILIKEI